MKAKIVTGYIGSKLFVKVRAGEKGTGRVLFQHIFFKDNSSDIACAALAAWQRENQSIECGAVWGYDKQQ